MYVIINLIIIYINFLLWITIRNTNLIFQKYILDTMVETQILTMMIINNIKYIIEVEYLNSCEKELLFMTKKIYRII